MYFFLFQSNPAWIKWPKFSPFFQTISRPSGAQHKAHRHQSLLGERTALWYRTVQVSNISWPLQKKTTTAARWRGRMVLTRKKSVLLWKVSFGNKICSSVDQAKGKPIANLQILNPQLVKCANPKAFTFFLRNWMADTKGLVTSQHFSFLILE